MGTALGLKDRIARLEQQRAHARRFTPTPEHTAQMCELLDLYRIGREVTEGLRTDPTPEDLPVNCDWATYGWLLSNWRDSREELSEAEQSFLDAMSESIRSEGRSNH